MNTTLVCRGRLESLPPVLSTALGLARLGSRVRLVVSAVTPPTAALLAREGIEVLQVQPGYSEPQYLLEKVSDWRSFRSRAWRAIDPMGSQMLWIASADTALALGGRLGRYPYILQLHELYDRHPLYRYGLRQYARQARCLVVPEPNRASIFRCWFNLAHAPVVLPNKPLDHPHDRSLPICDAEAQAIVQSLTGKKLLLYQGHIGPGRDLKPIAEAVSRMPSDYHLVLMGVDRHGLVPQLTGICPRTSHIRYVMPPGHLTVTSHAYVGLVNYDHDSLNSLFCAPNKIWEYAGFGVPILAGNIPGLLSTVGTAGAGICTDWDDPSRILEDLRRLEEHYSQFSDGARRFYDSIDTRAILQDVVQRASQNCAGVL